MVVGARTIPLLGIPSSFPTIQFQVLSYKLLAEIIETLIYFVRETSLSSDVTCIAFFLWLLFLQGLKIYLT